MLPQHRRSQHHQIRLASRSISSSTNSCFATSLATNRSRVSLRAYLDSPRRRLVALSMVRYARVEPHSPAASRRPRLAAHGRKVHLAQRQHQPGATPDAVLLQRAEGRFFSTLPSDFRQITSQRTLRWWKTTCISICKSIAGSRVTLDGEALRGTQKSPALGRRGRPRRAAPAIRSIGESVALSFPQ